MIVVLVAGYFAGWFTTQRPYTQAELKPQQLTANSSEDPVAVASISPDGKYLLYSDLEGLHLRLMASGENAVAAHPRCHSVFVERVSNGPRMGPNYW